jgi:hypothetical protein
MRRARAGAGAGASAAAHLEVVVLGDALGHALRLVVAARDGQREAREQRVQERGRPQVRAVQAVVRGLRVLPQPRSLVGRVVQHDVADGQHLRTVSSVRMAGVGRRHPE